MELPESNQKLTLDELFSTFKKAVKLRGKGPLNFSLTVEREMTKLLSWLQQYLQESQIEYRRFYIGNGSLAGEERLDILEVSSAACERPRLKDSFFKLNPTGLYEIPSQEIYIWKTFLMDEINNLSLIFFLAYSCQEQLARFLKSLRAFSREKSRKRNRVITIGGDISRSGKFTWDDLILPDKQKESIRSDVEGFFSKREVYLNIGLPYKRGILFYGPAGNGKTFICQILASQYEVPFLYFLPDKKADNTDVAYLFSLARDLAPCILCIEDMDAIFNSNISLAYFLNKMDGLEEVEGVLTIATTNHPERLEASITNRPSRFDRLYKIENPGAHCRKIYLQRLLNGRLDNDLLAQYARRSEGFSMTHLKELAVSATLLALKEQREAISPKQMEISFSFIESQVRAYKTDFSDREKLGFMA